MDLYLDLHVLPHIRGHRILQPTQVRSIPKQRIQPFNAILQEYYCNKSSVLVGKWDIHLPSEYKFVSALIVPAFPALEAYARKKGIAYGDHRELIGKEEIVRLF